VVGVVHEQIVGIPIHTPSHTHIPSHTHAHTHTVPTVPGGGTVTFVSRQKQEYDPNIEHREEGGTPGELFVCVCACVCM
jgi:hypothetical protein